MAAPTNDDYTIASRIAASATAMATAASQIGTAAVHVAAASTELAAAATALTARCRQYDRRREWPKRSTCVAVGNTACLPSNRVLSTPESLEAILLGGRNIATLLILKRVNKCFKSTIEGSVDIKKHMFFQEHDRSPAVKMKDFTQLNPMLWDGEQTPSLLKQFDFDIVAVDPIIYVKCESAAYIHDFTEHWDIRSIMEFHARANIERDPSSQASSAAGSWEATRIANVSIPLSVCLVQETNHGEMTDQDWKTFQLAADSTLSDLLRGLCGYQGKIAAAYVGRLEESIGQLWSTSEDPLDTVVAASAAPAVKCLAGTTAFLLRHLRSSQVKNIHLLRNRTMDKTCKELTKASESMAQQATASVAEATKKAEWAASVIDWASKLVAEQSQPSQTNALSREYSPSPHSAREILSHEAISIRQLFLLQRVNTQFTNTIAGSIQLQKKLWLHPNPTNDHDEDALVPSIADEQQRFRIIDKTSFDFDYVGDYSENQFSVSLCWDSKTNGMGKQSDLARLMALATGNAVKPGSWQRMLIY
ncbi:hypothetical protein LTR95_014004 [Oleoguttula sp. CCFEE 5521]